MDNKKIYCPECGQLIELKPMDGDPKKVIAFHNCGSGAKVRAVYVADALPEPAPTLKSKTKES
jgi:hypothetical protein